MSSVSLLSSSAILKEREKMKRALIAAGVVCFAIPAFANGLQPNLGTSFSAHNVNGYSNVLNPQAGDIVFDGSGATPGFWGYGGSSLGWLSFGGSSFINPMSAPGDMIYGGPAGAPARLLGSASNTRKFLNSTAISAVAQDPTWSYLRSESAQTSSYALAESDETVLFDVSSAATATLPTAASVANQEYYVRNVKSSQTIF
jgi:hypothetical protein